MTLPPVAAELTERWNFVPTEELPAGYCCRVFVDETRLLRVPFQGEEMTTGFVATLKCAGNPGPAVYASDPDSAIVLMQRLRPGTPLDQTALTDEEQQDVVIELIRAMRGLDVNGMASVSTWFEDDQELVKHLLATTQRTEFLHGDLHHGNVLLDGNRWTPIDPKGLVGDLAFECAAYLRNPLSSIPPLEEFIPITRRRIRRFAEALDLDPYRIWAWSLADMRSGEATRSPASRWWTVQRALEHLRLEFVVSQY